MPIELVEGKQHLVIKRDGRIEPYNPEKLRKVLLWATEENEIMVDEILRDIDLKIYNKIHISTLFDEVIDTVANKISELYPQWNEVAKRLYIQKIYKETWGMKRDKYPDYVEVVKKAVELNLYDKNVIDTFTEEELRELGEYIKPERDFNFDYLGLRVFMDKYSLNIDKYHNLELPQQGFMRLAIFSFYKEPKDIRLDLIKQRYDDLSLFRYSEATPKWINSLTDNPQMSSCVLTAMGDDMWSILHNIEQLGLYSKWSGGTATDVSHLRCKGSKIRQSGMSMGAVSFIKLIEAVITSANQQGKRSGANCIYYNWWSTDTPDITMLKDEGGTEDQRARKLKYAVKINRLFLKRVIKGEDITLFDPKEVPELLDTYGEEFDKWYEYYENKEGIMKKKMSARELIELILKIRVETGNLYIFFIENANEHTPFEDYINSSNLCLHPDTEILTREFGYIKIKDIAGQKLHIWNGEEWSLSDIFKTNDNYNKWYKIIFYENEYGEKREVITTDYHRWYCVDRDVCVLPAVYRTYELQKGDLILEFEDENGWVKQFEVIEIEELKDFISDSYCFYEPKLNRGVVNGVLTGNCTEVMLPSKPSYLKEDKLVKDISSDVYEVEREVMAGQVALCNLSSINIVEWMKLSDEEKKKIAYNLLRASDNLIDYAFYPVKEGELFNKKYRAIGIGLSNLAQYFASKKILFTDDKALIEMNNIMRDIYYHIIYASTELAKERGVFEGYYETKWSKRWMPVYIPELAERIQKYGVRFSTHLAIAPTSTSALIIGATESTEPIKEYVSNKTGTYNCKQLASHLKEYREYYQLAWEISNERLFELASIRQKYIDQGQSINQYDKGNYSSFEIFKEILYAEKLGLKSLYYFVPRKAELDECESCSS